MSTKAKGIVLAVLLALIWLLSFGLAQFESVTIFYSEHIYPPIQSGRMVVFGFIPFSIGDVLYVCGWTWLLITLLRWVYYVRKIGAHKERLGKSVLNTIIVGATIYLLFLIGWGANYSKKPLAESWHLNTRRYSTEERTAATEATRQFNRFLVSKLNAYALHYKTTPRDHINEKAKAYYRTYTNSHVKKHGLEVKATLFSYPMQIMGIDGYYNPFTGEGQICTGVPLFVMPFTLCHEMAHQAGIASEGDANLLAYAVCTKSNDATFRYAAYLNLWLYANNRLFRFDSVSAKELEAQLNPLTLRHIDTVEQLEKRYRGLLSHYTSIVYDSYLHMQDQEKGIKSYGNVIDDAWQLEKRGKFRVGTIPIP